MTGERKSAGLKFLEQGRLVIKSEIRALTQLLDHLGEEFSKAVELLINTEGKIIVSGMGKSGHIGRKIAATLSSTGNPAHFVHPAEASHGDLGVLAKGDTVLILSNSGETPELAHLISHVKRFSIPTIGVASVSNSTLIQNSTVGIILPKAGEACGTGIVPSNSTTMLLALGDALAITLMKSEHFSVDTFREFHPGGKLGARLTKVETIMHNGSEIPLVETTTPMDETLLTMTKKGFGVAGIVSSGGNLKGIITDGDLRRHMNGLLGHTAGDVMTPNPITISPDSLAEEALALMNENGVTCLFVIDQKSNSKVVGILHVHDCLRLGVV